MNVNSVRDERTLSVENASYRLAYLFVTYGLLVSAAYRGLVLGQTSWDLLGLVVASGLVTTVYQGRMKVLSSRWVLVTVVTAAVAAALAAGIALVRLR